MEDQAEWREGPVLKFADASEPITSVRHPPADKDDRDRGEQGPPDGESKSGNRA